MDFACGFKPAVFGKPHNLMSLSIWGEANYTNFRENKILMDYASTPSPKTHVLIMLYIYINKKPVYNGRKSNLNLT